MTTKEAQQLLATTAAEFLANPYNLSRDIAMNESENTDFQQALAVLGEGWENQLAWQVTATCGDTTATA